MTSKFLFLSLIVSTVLCHSPRLVEIAKEVNSRKTTWLANEATPLRDYTQMMGTLPNKASLPIKRVHVRGDLPESFNAFEKWPSCPSIVKILDQGECASCWAFGVAQVATDRYCIANDGKENIPLSAEDLLTCCDTCGFHCNGGYTGSAWEYVRLAGLATGGEYEDKNWCTTYAFPKCEHGISGQYPPCSSKPPVAPECSPTCNEGYPIPYEQDRHKCKTAFQLEPDVEQIKSEIFENGPVEATFQVFEDFVTYKSGIYKHETGKQLTLHTVKIIGWGVEDGVPFWRIVNSWNEDWGEKGQFRMLMGSNECAIESQVEGGMF